MWAASTGHHPSRFLQLESAHFRSPPTPGTTCGLPGPLSHREVHTNQGHGRKTGSGAAHTVSKRFGLTCSDTALAVPRTPQVVPPLHQPPPGWPATQCQQVVQPPGKSTGRGVTFDPSADKTAPAGGPSSQDHGRSTTRGWGDGGRSVSCPRGVQETASVQPPHQEGDLPSRSMPSVPPPVAPERTPPQQGGQPKTSQHDPA